MFAVTASKFSNVRDSQAETPFENTMTDSAAKTQPQRKHVMFVGPSNIKRKKKLHVNHLDTELSSLSMPSLER